MAIEKASIASAAAEKRKKLIEEQRRIEAELAKIDDAAKEEAMGIVTSGLNQLSELGAGAWDIMKMIGAQLGLPVNTPEPEKRARKASTSADGRKGTRPIPEGKVCPICEFGTVPSHDARKHRSQSEKKPFTAEELTSLGLTRA